MRRIFEFTRSDLQNLNRDLLFNTIKHSEGRTLMAETVVACQPLAYSVSNPELAASFAADMVTLNCFDCDKPFVCGWDDGDRDVFNTSPMQFVETLQDRIKKNINDATYIDRLRNCIGRPVGVNLEPVADGLDFPAGRRLSSDTLRRVNFWQFDYVVITGNPNTGVTSQAIIQGIKLAKAELAERTLIIAGKMHGAGSGNIYDSNIVSEFAEAGADVVLIPAPGTIPGMDLDIARQQVTAIHACGALALTAMGTSQEGSSIATVEQIALLSKMAGTDIMHIGDAGFAGIAPPENIMAASIAIRGKRHTYARMGRSIMR